MTLCDHVLLDIQINTLLYSHHEKGVLSIQYKQISTNGGAQPRWRRDGKELFYLALDGKMMAVDIKADSKIELGTPHVLFDTNLIVDPGNNQYAVTSDGQRFLILNSLSEAIPTPVTLVTNRTSLLEQ